MDIGDCIDSSLSTLFDGLLNFVNNEPYAFCDDLTIYFQDKYTHQFLYLWADLDDIIFSDNNLNRFNRVNIVVYV